jgi:hypothetical protein
VLDGEIRGQSGIGEGREEVMDGNERDLEFNREDVGGVTLTENGIIEDGGRKYHGCGFLFFVGSVRRLWLCARVRSRWKSNS